MVNSAMELCLCQLHDLLPKQSIAYKIQVCMNCDGLPINYTHRRNHWCIRTGFITICMQLTRQLQSGSSRGTLSDSRKRDRRIIIFNPLAPFMLASFPGRSRLQFLYSRFFVRHRPPRVYPHVYLTSRT